MKNCIPVEIPTKRYIAAYVKSKLGDKPFMSTDHKIGQKLHDVLEHSTNERRKEFANKRYNEKLRIYISNHTFSQRGANLNETNIKNLNLFIEEIIKDEFRLLMDTLMEIFPSFTANLPTIRRKLGIDIEAWDDDSMRKDYYRYRLRSGLPLLYDKSSKTSTRTVPSRAVELSCF